MRIAGVVLVVLAAACSGSFGTDPSEKPVLLAASSEAVTVGAPLEFFGANFMASGAMHTELRFKGEFHADSGQTYAVDYRMHPHWVDGNRVVWAQVGPFANPFVPDDPLGTFDGEVTAINVDDTNAEVRSDPMPYSLAFQPSIVIKELRPLKSSCGEPVKRILGGYYYRVEVEAVGFTPVNFTYAIAGESKYDRPRIYRQPATGQTDSFGDNYELLFQPVPDDEVFYLINLSVAAMGTDGKERTNSLVFAVHRPIEYIDSGKVKVAEVLAPQPDSGCIAGGSTGRNVTYTETHTDTRTRQVGVNWSEAWSQVDQQSYTYSHGTSDSINITRSESQTEGTTLGWSWDIGVGAEGGFLGFAKASVNTSFGLNGSYSRSYTQGWSVGRTYTESDTESWAFSQQRGYTLTKGGSDFWTVSSSDSTSLAYGGQIMPGMYGVFYRQTVRMALPGAIVAYDLCGNPEVVGETHFFDYTWSIDLATGGECPPFPQSSLPPATCYITPCVNE